MDFVEKYQTVFVLIAIVGGLALGQVSGESQIESGGRLILLPYLAEDNIEYQCSESSISV